MNSVLRLRARTASRQAHPFRPATPTSSVWAARRLMSTHHNPRRNPKMHLRASTEFGGSHGELQAKEDEVKEMTNRLRYAQADFINLQRNAQREKDQTRDYAITKLAKDLVGTVDVLTLALKSVPEDARKGNHCTRV
ncbi:co-chaperone GrpE [Ceratobasidium sp. AG-Ba]|nr:co-chaperone GrpE [Ceratobasidium sp. AG-Ba]